MAQQQKERGEAGESSYENSAAAPLHGPSCVVRLRKRWRRGHSAVHGREVRWELGADLTARGSPGDCSAALGGSLDIELGERGRLRLKHGYMRKGWGNGLSGPTFLSYEKDTRLGVLSVELGRTSLKTAISDPYKLLKVNIETELQMDGLVPRAPQYTRVDPQPQDTRLVAVGGAVVACTRMPVKIRRTFLSGTGNAGLEVASSMRMPSLKTLQGGELSILELNPVFYLDDLPLLPITSSETNDAGEEESGSMGKSSARV